MGIKSVILPDHMQVNKFTLDVGGMPPLTLMSVGGMEAELDTVDLPDRTSHSGGREKPQEFDIVIPMHHKQEIAAMELWYQANKDPVQIDAKRVGVLSVFSQSDIAQKSWMLNGLYPMKEGIPELDLDNDGEMASMTYGMKCDERQPLT